jgi:hypothetical protein
VASTSTDPLPSRSRRPEHGDRFHRFLAALFDAQRRDDGGQSSDPTAIVALRRAADDVTSRRRPTPSGEPVVADRFG